MIIIGCVLSLVAFCEAGYTVFKNRMLWGEIGRAKKARSDIFVTKWANK
jgi:hypothetical protein